MRSTLLLSSFASLLSFARVSVAFPADVTDLRARTIATHQVLPSYDYIVVGGGTAGLVVATELSDDPSKTILVVEYGAIVNDPSQEDPQSAITFKPSMMFNVTSVPLPGLNGLSNATILAAAVAGGASRMNGMMLPRGPPVDFDNWQRLSNPGWGWKDLFPYFKKNTQYMPPTPDMARQFNITWDASAYGSSKSPLHASYPTFMYPNTKNMVQGLIEAGSPKPREGALDTVGTVWFPTMMDGKTVKRSDSFDAFYEPRSSRRNLHLLTNHRVNEVLFDHKKHATGITYQSPSGGAVKTVKAKLEIILAAGSLHTPQVLQRSGIGAANLLRKAKIPVLVDLPGVGANFQDHPSISRNFTFQRDLFPNPNTFSSNSTFISISNALWDANRTGRLSFGQSNTAAWVPLPILAPDWKNIVRSIESQNPATYLPKSYDSTLIKGYRAQLAILKDAFSGNQTGVMEMPLNGRGDTVILLQHPLSRGTINVDPRNKYGEPILDFNTYANPIDPLITARGLQFLRKWMSTSSMKALSPVELSPGAHVVTDKALVEYARSHTVPTFGHGCCTAAMSPRALGGVVSPDLLVYGVTGLSVADASIPPLHIGSHPCETVFAIASKAVDFIKARHSAKGWPGY